MKAHKLRSPCNSDGQSRTPGKIVELFRRGVQKRADCSKDLAATAPAASFFRAAKSGRSNTGPPVGIFAVLAPVARRNARLLRIFAKFRRCGIKPLRF